MKNFVYILSLIISVVLISCGGSTEKKESVADDTPIVYGEHKVEVYYFHGDRRCPACNAVERVAKTTVNEEFANNEDVEFFVINFDRNHNKEIANKYDITWSSLLIVSGDKVMDLTLEGFQFAPTNPDVFKVEIVDVINNFLKA